MVVVVVVGAGAVVEVLGGGDVVVVVVAEVGSGGRVVASEVSLPRHETAKKVSASKKSSRRMA